MTGWRASSRPHIGLALLEAACAAGGVEELLIPERVDEARKVDSGGIVHGCAGSSHLRGLCHMLGL